MGLVLSSIAAGAIIFLMVASIPFAIKMAAILAVGVIWARVADDWKE